MLVEAIERPAGKYADIVPMTPPQEIEREVGLYELTPIDPRDFVEWPENSATSFIFSFNCQPRISRAGKDGMYQSSSSVHQRASVSNAHGGSVRQQQQHAESSTTSMYSHNGMKPLTPNSDSFGMRDDGCCSDDDSVCSGMSDIAELPSPASSSSMPFPSAQSATHLPNSISRNGSSLTGLSRAASLQQMYAVAPSNRASHGSQQQIHRVPSSVGSSQQQLHHVTSSAGSSQQQLHITLSRGTSQQQLQPQRSNPHAISSRQGSMSHMVHADGEHRPALDRRISLASSISSQESCASFQSDSGPTGLPCECQLIRQLQLVHRYTRTRLTPEHTDRQLLSKNISALVARINRVLEHGTKSRLFPPFVRAAIARCEVGSYFAGTLARMPESVVRDPSPFPVALISRLLGVNEQVVGVGEVDDVQDDEDLADLTARITSESHAQTMANELKEMFQILLHYATIF